MHSYMAYAPSSLHIVVLKIYNMNQKPKIFLLYVQLKDLKCKYINIYIKKYSIQSEENIPTKRYVAHHFLSIPDLLSVFYIQYLLTK